MRDIKMNQDGIVNTRWIRMTLGLALCFIPACADNADVGDSFGSQPSAGYCRDKRIVNGKTEVSFHGAGALVGQGEVFCTGTLVDTTTVVTAAHCLYGSSDPNGLQMYFGPDARKFSTGTVVDVVSIHLHPEYNDATTDNDIAVLKLAQPVSINPIRLLTQPMADSWIGTPVAFVGYGVTRHNKDDGGIKRSVQIPLSEIMTHSFRYDSPTKNTCFGDSGGGAFVKIDGEHFLVGVTSYGDESCTEYGVNTRVDTYGAFLRKYLADEPCAGIGTGTAASGWDAPSASSAEPAGRGDGSQWTDTSPRAARDGSQGDFCEEEGWYGDGVCDEDCPNPDSDC
jgi:secreted trypsin-like serine protease